MDTLTIVPSIDLIIGPMRSGKTTELIKRLNMHAEMGKKVLYVNSALDTRSDEAFSSYSSVGMDSRVTKTKVQTLPSDPTAYDVIGVDEAQFFSGLLAWVDGVVSCMGKIVIVAGLNGDFRAEPFGEVNSLVPVCDKVTKLSAFCQFCMDKEGVATPAIFTHRTSSETGMVVIGGKEAYVPLCRQCFSRAKFDKLAAKVACTIKNGTVTVGDPSEPLNVQIGGWQPSS